MREVTPEGVTSLISSQCEYGTEQKKAIVRGFPAGVAPFESSAYGRLLLGGVCRLASRNARERVHP